MTDEDFTGQETGPEPGPWPGPAPGAWGGPGPQPGPSIVPVVGPSQDPSPTGPCSLQIAGGGKPVITPDLGPGVPAGTTIVVGGFFENVGGDACDAVTYECVLQLNSQTGLQLIDSDTRQLGQISGGAKVSFGPSTFSRTGIRGWYLIQLRVFNAAGNLLNWSTQFQIT